MSKKKSLAQRAADAVSGKAKSTELLAIYTEISGRLAEIDREQSMARGQLDSPGSDVEKLKEARQLKQDLEDEERVLRNRSTAVYQAHKVARGEEAVAGKSSLDQSLEKALEAAQEAQSILEECRRITHEVIQARRDAAEIGEVLRFDPDTVSAISKAIHPDSNAIKQCMIDLGAARLAASVGGRIVRSRGRPLGA